MQNMPKDTFPAQHQDKQPGKESQMNPLPVYNDPNYKAAGKLAGKTVVITGGDSGIGRAVAVACAKEGADVAILYLEENDDAERTLQEVAALGHICLKIAVNLKEESEVQSAVTTVMDTFGKIDVLINNAGVQYVQNSILEIPKEQLIHTFESNFYSCFYMTKAALPHMQSGGSIINTTSITAFEGHELLIDYSATKGAMVSFTRSMAMSLVNQNIRVNAVAPGPVWTPLIVSSFSAEQVRTFGSTSPMQRAAQPYELAPIYIYLASDDSSNMTGQILHVNSGTVIN